MNQQQRKYARERVGVICAKKERELRKKHTTESVRLSRHERFKAFKNGDYTIKKGVSQEITSYTDVMDIVDFKGEKKEKVNETALQKDLASVREQANNIVDQIMLGDAEEAMKLIEEFSK